MLFRLENRSSGQATHTGVLEFIADEGMAYIPYWVSFLCTQFLASALIWHHVENNK